MKNNLYDVSRNVYGGEVVNMQPVAFGYVPVKQRVEAVKPADNEVACIGEFCDNRNNGRFIRVAVQH
jgi:hypothetical protein